MDKQTNNIISYSLTKVAGGIYYLEIKNAYDLAMTFWRTQEFYENSNPDFRGKKFSLNEFMNWYAKNISQSSTFSYAEDWDGFNVPSSMIEQCYLVNCERMPHDEFMLFIHSQIRKNTQTHYYLIGAKNSNQVTYQHELAHGLFSVNSVYKKQMLEHVKNLDNQVYKKLEIILKKVGYSDEVISDEIHAYMATGLSQIMKGMTKPSDHKPFKKTFKEFNQKIKSINSKTVKNKKYFLKF